ncbi:MAG: orotate phosphoribosyltransferase [Telmatospirillum sp.]|nr:orotate phosphoribosyltransferase [Telmatospirillum sp.]
MTLTEIGQVVSQLLFRAGAIHVSRKQPYVLAAGWASPVYVDCRVLLGEPELRHTVMDLVADYVALSFPAGSFDAIAGAETAGIPFAAWLAERCNLKLRYVRKGPLGIGRNAQVEGGPVDGLRVLLIDDLTTDGGSKLAFARGLRMAGATVEHILTIFYHDVFPGADDRLTEAGLKLHALATWADVLQADLDGRLSIEDRAEIERFVTDPVSWSMWHGGRMTLPPR